MNWLAHVFLSDSDIRFQLGNLLADAVKGRPWEGMSEMGVRGMRRHQWIDAYTDAHEVVKRSIARLGERGRLRSVVVDVVYDHMLTRNWRRFSQVDLADYLDDFHQRAWKEAEGYPELPRNFVHSLVERSGLAGYSDMAGVKRALERIDCRLSDTVRKREVSSKYLPVLEEHYAALEEDFLEFFPTLMAELPDPRDL